MTEFVLAVTGAFYGWLLTYLLHSTVLLLAVWVVCRVGWVRHPATQDVLWKVALLGALVTATATTLRDAPGRRQEPKAVAVRTVSAAAASSRLQHRVNFSGWLRGSLTAGPLEPLAAVQVATPSESCRSALTSFLHDRGSWVDTVREACPTPRAFLWQHGVVFLWLLGTLLTLGVLVRRRRALGDALGALRAAGPRSRAALERVMGSGWKIPARLATSATADAPCVVHATMIVLPDRCEEQLTDEELDAVVAHEFAHVQRRDVPWLAVMRAVEAVFWIQPLNRLALAGSLEATELDCDDRAVACTGRPLGLARSLARIAEWSVTSRRLHSEPALVSARRGRLSARVDRILAPTRPKRRSSRWSGLAAAVLVAPAFMLPSVPAAPVVRRAVLYELDASDGTAPTLMLLGETAEMEGRPLAPNDGMAEPSTEDSESASKL